MSTAVSTPAPAATTAAARRTAGIPLSRVTSTELRKMFDTRSGFWLMASIGILALLATAAVVVFAPDEELTYNSFGAAVGIPMTIILPIVALLSVTSEWSQRSGLTTFTLVPHRGRVIAAKAICSVGVGVAGIVLALAVGALGNLVGSAIAGVDPVWNVSTAALANLVLGNVLNLLIGFMLGVLFRSSAAAIVGYFVYSFVLPTLSMLLASSQEWFRDIQLWVDFNFAQAALFEGTLTSEQWAQLGVTGVVWLALPILVGVRLVMRSEVK
ncbi:MAG TPA: ABC transporter permease [Nocardioidaceae bacterium]|nr:ABC transporter permease [Nocardioidaceae bacterium]